jgi:hypothetical protein
MHGPVSPPRQNAFGAHAPSHAGAFTSPQSDAPSSTHVQMLPTLAWVQW